MPASYRILADARLVHSGASGALTGGEMIAHAAALAADPAFAPDYAQLTDFRAATRFETTPAEIRRLAELNPFDRTARRVGLVGSAVAFGLLRMYQILSETEDSGTLVTRDEAEAWRFLGLAPGVLDSAARAAWSSSDAG
ncbi:hypothetical protein [Roseisolibacter sp. H3M3-2]|uniref:hypothetical protein n=1 Tax=Roseisolibacter sp. H3M3-2 TaxID=3031323 RepID=UPI0023DBF875|nr:hypothetical protein [Roseisolibacter sp. H3M3-2]MDF1503720.1 hypothetical protein [Roseisolibacter sp. H3M3-2]